MISSLYSLDIGGMVKTSKKVWCVRPVGIRRNGIRWNGHKSLHLPLNSQHTGEFPSPFLLPTSFLPLQSPSITRKYQKRRLNRAWPQLPPRQYLVPKQQQGVLHRQGAYRNRPT